MVARLLVICLAIALTISDESSHAAAARLLDANLMVTWYGNPRCAAMGVLGRDSEHLFTPLAITDVHWKPTPTGHPDTEGGLYLEGTDLAKIGRLMLQGGRWNGRQVVPQSYVNAAVTRHVTGLPGGFDYGYQWWITRRGDRDVWAGRGFGGQFLIVIPSLDMVGVANAWNVFPFDPARDVRPRNLQNALIDAMVGWQAGAARQRRSPGRLSQ